MSNPNIMTSSENMEWVEETWHDPTTGDGNNEEYYYEEEEYYDVDEFGGDEFYEVEEYFEEEVIGDEEEEEDEELGSSAFLSEDFDLQALMKQQLEDDEDDDEMDPFELYLPPADEVSSLEDISESSFVVGDEMFITMHNPNNGPDTNSGEKTDFGDPKTDGKSHQRPKLEQTDDWGDDDDDDENGDDESFAYDDFVVEPVADEDEDNYNTEDDDDAILTIDGADDVMDLVRESKDSAAAPTTDDDGAVMKKDNLTKQQQQEEVTVVHIIDDEVDIVKETEKEVVSDKTLPKSKSSKKSSSFSHKKKKKKKKKSRKGQGSSTISVGGSCHTIGSTDDEPDIVLEDKEDASTTLTTDKPSKPQDVSIDGGTEDDAVEPTMMTTQRRKPKKSHSVPKKKKSKGKKSKTADIVSDEGADNDDAIIDEASTALTTSTGATHELTFASEAAVADITKPPRPSPSLKRTKSKKKSLSSSSNKKKKKSKDKCAINDAEKEQSSGERNNHINPSAEEDITTSIARNTDDEDNSIVDQEESTKEESNSKQSSKRSSKKKKKSSSTKDKVNMLLSEEDDEINDLDDEIVAGNDLDHSDSDKKKPSKCKTKEIFDIEKDDNGAEDNSEKPTTKPKGKHNVSDDEDANKVREPTQEGEAKDEVQEDKADARDIQKDGLPEEEERHRLPNLEAQKVIACHHADTMYQEELENDSRLPTLTSSPPRNPMDKEELINEDAPRDEEEVDEEIFFKDLGGNFWGRTNELEALDKSFKMIDESEVENVPRIAWVHGNAGVGKTALVKEFLRRNDECCVSCYGSFEEKVAASRPFSAVVDCLSELVRRLKNDETVSNWRGRIRGCLGADSRLLATLVPDLATFLELATWTKLPEFDMSSRRLYDRLRFVTRRFIWLVCQYHRLVFVLDDMQWAGQDSLMLVETILSINGIRNFFFVGSHRGIKKTHALERLKGLLRPICAVNTTLTYMGSSGTAELVAGYLNTLTPTKIDENVMKLSQLLFNKYEGNPLPLVQSLLYLLKRNLLTPSEDGWIWDADMIEKEYAIRSNSMELVLKRLELLNSENLLVLKAAGLLGLRTFRTDPLMQSVRACFRSQKKKRTDSCPIKSVDQVETILDDLVADSLIEKVTTRLYQFTHDTIRKAAVSLLPDGTKKRQILHLNLASGLASLRVTKSYDKKPLEKEELKYLLVEHYGAALGHLRSEKEKELYAKLSLELAEVKMAKAATLAAVRNINSGLSVLDKSNRWEPKNGLAAKMHLTLARLKFCVGALGEALGLCNEIIQHAISDRDKLDALELIIYLHVVKGDLEGAYNATASALSEYFDEDLAESAEQAVVRVRDQLSGIDKDEISSLPKMKHKKAASNLRFLSLLVEISILRRDHATQDIAALRMVEFTLLYGSSPFTALSFSLYGMCLIRRGLFAEAYRFGHLAETISSLENKNDALSVGLHHRAIHYWRKPSKASLPALMNVSRSAIDSNDMEHLSIFVGAFFSTVLVSGASLTGGDAMFQAFQTHRSVFGARDAWQATLPFQMILKLRGRFDGTIDLSGLSGVTNDNSAQTMGTQLSFFFRIVAAVYFQEHDKALKLKEKLFQRPFGVLLPYQAFIEGLIATHFVRTTSSHKEKHDHQRKAAKIIDVLQSWGKKGLKEVAHMTYILSTELHIAIRKDLSPAKIGSLYDVAMETAAKQGFFHHEALASERAGLHFLQLEEPRFARKYLSKAYFLYSGWGARGKVEHLERHHEEHLTAPIEAAPETPTMGSGGRGMEGGRISGRRPVGRGHWTRGRISRGIGRGRGRSFGNRALPTLPHMHRGGPGRALQGRGYPASRSPPALRAPVRTGRFQNNPRSMRSIVLYPSTDAHGFPRAESDLNNEHGTFDRPPNPQYSGTGRGRGRADGPPIKRGGRVRGPPMRAMPRGGRVPNYPGLMRSLKHDAPADVDDNGVGIFARPVPSAPPRDRGGGRGSLTGRDGRILNRPVSMRGFVSDNPRGRGRGRGYGSMRSLMPPRGLPRGGRSQNFNAASARSLVSTTPMEKTVNDGYSGPNVGDEGADSDKGDIKAQKGKKKSKSSLLKKLKFGKGSKKSGNGESVASEDTDEDHEEDHEDMGREGEGEEAVEDEEVGVEEARQQNKEKKGKTKILSKFSFKKTSKKKTTEETTED